MSTAFVPFALQGPAAAEITSVPPWKLDGLKDLSPGGICETGYGNKNTTQKTLQFLSNIKHREKYIPYLAWGVAAIPALLDVVPEILYDKGRRTPFKDIPGRTRAVLKKKMGSVSAEQLGFLLSIIPLYYNARTIKNSIWVGSGLDPSGHTMFKITQYGMMLSIATDHGKKSRIATPIIYFMAFTVIADAVMLVNTITNCHTLTEVIVAGGLGAAILLTAHFIGKYTPLGHVAREITHIASEIVGSIGRNLRRGQVPLPGQVAV